MTNRRMGRPVLFFLFLGVFVFLPAAFAQPADSLPPVENKHVNSLKPGAWALQFQITDNFSFKSFQGFGISLKHHFSSSKALRFGVGMSTAFSDFDGEGQTLQGDTIRQRDFRESEVNSESFDFGAQYVFYLAPKADIHLFLATGPLVRYSHFGSDEKLNRTYDSTNSMYSSNGKDNRWTLGIAGIFGTEWFITKSISLIGEYGTSFEHTWAKRTFTARSSPGSTTSKSETTEKSLRFNLASVKFGLSVYF